MEAGVVEILGGENSGRGDDPPGGVIPLAANTYPPLGILFTPGMDLEYAVDPHGDTFPVFTPPCDYCGLCVDVADDGSGHRVICAECAMATQACSLEGEEQCGS